ncbi:MAG: hypothetical protein K2L99_05455, partial [Muribaculaceae bacterium]|nr:hypothetical protein [Muribaculaceae bacterium]
VWFSPLLCSSICLFLLVRHAGSLFGFRSWRFWAQILAGATLLGLIFRLTVWKYTVVEQMAECIVITLLLYPLFRRGQEHRTTKILAAAALWTGLCAVAGSNTGFIKFLSIGIFPVAVALSRPWQARPVRGWLLLLIAGYCCVGGPVRVRESYKDAGPALADAQVICESHPMRGIRTTRQFAEYSEKAFVLARDLRKKGYEVRVLATGLNRFGWAVLTETEPAVNLHDWTEATASSCAELRAYLSEAMKMPHVAVIVPAPFAGEVQCREFAPYDADIIDALSSCLREEPSGIDGVRLFCGVLREQ